jgi:hypothetical protein
VRGGPRLQGALGAQGERAAGLSQRRAAGTAALRRTRWSTAAPGFGTNTFIAGRARRELTRRRAACCLPWRARTGS